MADRIGAEDLIKGKVASIISRFLDDIGGKQDDFPRQG
jgi:hypothetical protein